MNSIKQITHQEFINNLPTKEKQITAQYDEDNIVVYQAYNHAIANFALANQYFGGSSFKPERMTWVKPNFLWMMHRSAWASKPNQERVLAIKISRVFFEELLYKAVMSSYKSAIYESQEQWKEALLNSGVRVQWDPAYDIYDTKQDYRAIQIGMKGAMAKRYAQEEIVEIIDLTEFVHAQELAAKHKDLDILRLPEEKVYEVGQEIKKNIAMS